MLPHFHIPLQSGSNEILSRMRRRYRRELYAERVDRIVSSMPDAAIGVDVIVGFPGETEEQFQETYDFLNELPVAYFHVFTYSERENTPAAGIASVVPINVRRRRTNMLRILSEKKRAYFAERQQGSVHRVLFEHEQQGKILGFTDNYIRVEHPFHPSLENQIVPVRLGEFNGEQCVCQVVEEHQLAGFFSLSVVNITS